MASTNIPPNKEIKKVRIQLKIPDNDQFDVDVDTTYLEELLTMIVDCKYKGTGCIVNDYLKDIRKHERLCLYHTQPCLVPSKKDACKNVQTKNLVEHWIEHHNVDCMSIEENFFSLPIDLEQEVQLSKMFTVGEDIFLCSLKSDDYKLHISLLFIKTTNPNLNYKITLMADDMVCNKHKIQISNSVSGFNEYNEQSAVFDLQKLMQIRNVFNSIAVRVDWNIMVQENIVEDEQFLLKILCTFCGDFLTSTYYQCDKGHMHCNTCYELLVSIFIEEVKANVYSRYKLPIGIHTMCNRCKTPMNNIKLNLTLIDCLKKYQFACRNKSLGCNQFISHFTSKHALLCPFKVFKCAFVNCEFSGKYSEFTSHLQENHTDDIINSNVYGTVQNKQICYMFVFGSVFLSKTVDARTYTIEWISTSDLNHNFIFKATFVGDDKTMTLSTNSDPREINYKVNCNKSIYNTINKTVSFNVSANELSNVNKITLEIKKK